MSDCNSLRYLIEELIKAEGTMREVAIIDSSLCTDVYDHPSIIDTEPASNILDDLRDLGVLDKLGISEQD